MTTWIVIVNVKTPANPAHRWLFNVKAERMTTALILVQTEMNKRRYRTEWWHAELAFKSGKLEELIDMSLDEFDQIHDL